MARTSKRVSVLWNIWTPASTPHFAGELLNVGRINAWADTDPAEVVKLWIAAQQRLCSRPLTLDTTHYTAKHYPVTALDDFGD